MKRKSKTLGQRERKGTKDLVPLELDPFSYSPSILTFSILYLLSLTHLITSYWVPTIFLLGVLELQNNKNSLCFIGICLPENPFPKWNFPHPSRCRLRTPSNPQCRVRYSLPRIASNFLFLLRKEIKFSHCLISISTKSKVKRIPVPDGQLFKNL